MSDEKFNKYFELVQQEAAKQGKKFFMDTGEGRENITHDMEMEDLSGWLVPLEIADEFQEFWLLGEGVHNNLPDKFDNTYVFAIWSIDDGGKVQIKFNKY